MRILHLTMEYPPNIDGGVGIFSKNFCQEIAKNHQVDLIVKRGRIPYQKLSTQPNLTLYELKTSLIPGLRYPSFVWKSKKLVNEVTVNVPKEFMVVHGSIPHTIFGIKKTFPIVVTTHHTATNISHITRRTGKGTWKPWSESFLLPISPLIEKRCLDKADVIVAVSNGTAQVIINKFNLNPDKIMVIPNGIPDRVLIKPMNFETVSKRLSLPLDKEFFLFVGSLDERKGIKLLLKAISRLQNRVLQFVFVGRGNVGFYQRIAKKLGIEKNVIFTGYIPDELLMSLYKHASGFILPSYDEGLPTVLIESMYFGLPVITSKTSGGIEIIKDTSNGYLFTIGDYHDLVDKITILIEDKKLRRKIGSFNKRDVHRRFSWAKSASKYLLLFEQLNSI